MDKRGIELAANFIIILIISLVLFALASGLTYKIMCASSNQIDQLDSATEHRVEQLLNSGAAVTVADASKTAKQTASFCGSASAPAASYLLGIRNDFNDPPTQEFRISCTYNGVQIAEDQPLSMSWDSRADCDTPWQWQITDRSPSVDARKKYSGLIVLNAPPEAPAGRHVFTLRVTHDFTDSDGVFHADEQYGVKKIYLTIE